MTRGKVQTVRVTVIILFITVYIIVNEVIVIGGTVLYEP